MKRSDVIESLQELLDTCLYGDPKAAPAILFHLEGMGMLPPQIRIPGKPQSYGQDRYWEDEDEC